MTGPRQVCRGPTRGRQVAGRHSSGFTGYPSFRAASFCNVAMLMVSRNDRTDPSPNATLHMPVWKAYSSPWFHPLTVTAPFKWAAVLTLPNGATPGAIGPCVPAHTMLLLFWPHAPRTLPKLIGSAYWAPPDQ